MVTDYEVVFGFSELLSSDVNVLFLYCRLSRYAILEYWVRKHELGRFIPSNVSVDF